MEKNQNTAVDQKNTGKQTNQNPNDAQLKNGDKSNRTESPFSNTNAREKSNNSSDIRNTGSGATAKLDERTDNNNYSGNVNNSGSQEFNNAGHSADRMKIRDHIMETERRPFDNIADREESEGNYSIEDSKEGEYTDWTEADVETNDSPIPGNRN